MLRKVANYKLPWYRTYNKILRRCNDKKSDNYKNYGGRGIKCLITPEELKTLWFRDKAYNMDAPTIDRKNNDGNYSLRNCQYLELRENCVKKRYKPFCPQGHKFTKKNTIRGFDLKGHRFRKCATCIHYWNTHRPLKPTKRKRK